MKGFFYDTRCEDREGKTQESVGSSQCLVTAGVLNSQTRPHWASSSSSAMGLTSQGGSPHVWVSCELCSVSSCLSLWFPRDLTSLMHLRRVVDFW